MMRPRPPAAWIGGVANRLEAAVAATGTAHHGSPAFGRLCTSMSSFDPETVVDLARTLHTLRNDKCYAGVTAAARVTVYADLRPVAVTAEVAAFVGLAFCTLFHGALTRAHRCDGAGHVGIHLWPVATLPGVRAYLLIADDGQGFNGGPQATADSGAAVARHCVEQCGGTLTREAGSSTVWRITLPQ